MTRPSAHEIWMGPLGPLSPGGLARPRVGIAGISIESSTFSPHTSDDAAFTVRTGAALLAYYPFLDEGRDLREAAEWVVKLGGKHFTYLVNEGDKVKKGQPLIRFELEAIKAEGYPVTTPLIVCNTDDYAAVAAKASGAVKQGDALLELKH